MDRKIKPAGTEDFIREEDYLSMVKNGSVKRNGTTMYMSSTAASKDLKARMLTDVAELRNSTYSTTNGTANYAYGSNQYPSATVSTNGYLTVNGYGAITCDTASTIAVLPSPSPYTKKTYDRGSLRANLEAEINDWCGGILKR